TVRLELQYYPEARLTDIYKNFFQNAFGPGHLIKDAAAAKAYLRYELHNAKHFDSLLYQPLGADHRYYRLNLILLKKSVIPEDEFLNAFIQSANHADPPTIDEWKAEWENILKVITSMDLTILHFERDRAHLDSLLAEGEYVVHHSETYKSLYQPHYRIVHKDEFSKLKRYLPK
ncbi:MAG: hypothetical protein K9H13_01675, partial [Bacteroidales bacterium]|nr:hypothetical protein [Bacteroidales bacterium]